MLVWIPLCLLVPTVSGPPEFLGQDVGLRLVRQGDEWVEEVLARDDAGTMRVVLVSPTHAGLERANRRAEVTSLSRGSSTLFQESPTMRFDSYRESQEGSSQRIVLSKATPDVTIEKTIWIPRSGPRIRCAIRAMFAREGERIRYFLSTYAFAPDGKAMSQAGRPDDTYAPAIRPNESYVIGDHFFRAPAVLVQKGLLFGAIVPDLDVLRDNRPMPTIVDLDCSQRLVDAPLLSYGFCDYRLVGHVYFANDPSMLRRVPKEIELGFDLLVSARAATKQGMASTMKYLWDRYGHRYFNRVLPQAMPFEAYARACYAAAFQERYADNQLGWFETEIDGRKCGGVMAGWGYQQGWVSWQSWFNNLRSAWGMRWWGKRRNIKDLIEKADKMLNLALAAPMNQGACPTTYMSREKKWRGSLIMPRPECYYDLTNIAWKGIWLQRWLTSFEDCPRKEDIKSQLKSMVALMLRFQHADGSFPSWLTRDLEVVPVLDRSAQSALPAWFLAEYALASAARDSVDPVLVTAVKKAADFLVQEVVDGNYYYDFETFFSCSPKPCLQVNRSADHEAMRDPFTLQPPQNTLCMQWSAEALLRASLLTSDTTYQSAALQALDRLAAYQNVWPISYRGVAYTYGGFGVQNSDGEYHDARQAQFGVTLCQFGATFGRQDLFERGVAAVRASTALVNTPLHQANFIYPNPNYPPGLEPENCGHGGDDFQNGRTGFDWGEGSGLTAMAELLDEFGGAYVDDRTGWAVGIDGVAVADPQGDKVLAPLWEMAVPYTGPVRVDVVYRSGKRRNNVLAEPPHSVRTITARLDQDRLLLVAVPSFSLPDVTRVALSGAFQTADGKQFQATLGPLGFQASVERASVSAGPVTFKGKVGDEAIESRPQRVWIDPTFDFSDWRMPGWYQQGNIPCIPTWSRRVDFGNGGRPFIGTCERPDGGYDDGYQGTLISPPFLLTKPHVKLLVGGGSGEGVYVELVDANDSTQLAVARGQNRERMHEVTWDATPWKGKWVRLRIVDREVGGWGHINVANVRCE